MHRHLPFAALACLGLGLAGCDADTSDHVVETVRTVPGTLPKPTTDSGERLFGPAPAPPPPPFADLFEGPLPAGWKPLPPAPLRLLNYEVPGGAECYFTLLDAGDALSNVNRWRGQMGQEPIDPDALSALPTADLFRQEAILVELEGALTGMDGQRREGMALLGLFVELPRAGMTLKMTGPAEAVRAAKPAFLELAKNLRMKDFDVPEGAGAGAGDAAGSAGTAGAAVPFDPQALRYDAPAGWSEAQGSSMRLVTFRAGPDAACEAWVTVLPGDAGGVISNLDRWRREVGAPPLDPAAAETLPKLSVLGRDVIRLEADGAYTGMGGAPVSDARLLGVVVPQEGATVFVKMVGPREAMAGEGQAFDAFCESLRIADER